MLAVELGARGWKSWLCEVFDGLRIGVLVRAGEWICVSSFLVLLACLQGEMGSGSLAMR